MFNVDHGYLEGLVRGFRSGILQRSDYMNLVQCETIEGAWAGPPTLGTMRQPEGTVQTRQSDSQ